MKAPALLALTTVLTLAACQSPPPRPPGPRGYSLDNPPGDVRYGDEQPGVPTDTRYLDTTTPDPTAIPQPPNPNDPAAATVQPPAPTVPPVGAAPTTTPPTTAGTPPTTPPAPTPAPAPSPNSYPTATRTKPGFVKSPFDPLGREIDVREMRSGQKARCPYTQKIFLVP